MNRVREQLGRCLARQGQHWNGAGPARLQPSSSVPKAPQTRGMASGTELMTGLMTGRLCLQLLQERLRMQHSSGWVLHGL